MKKIFILFMLTALACQAFAWMNPEDADVDVLLNTDDNQFAFYNGPSGQAEWLLNNGAKTSIRLKGHDDPSAMKWDLSAYRGALIEEAELHLCRANYDPINALVVSTINTDWNEGSKWGAQAGTGEPCWRWQSFPDGEWTYPGSDFSTAAFGNFGTLVCFGYQHNDTFARYEKNGYQWIKMKLDPAVVHAMILDNHGIVVTDPRYGYENGNPQVYSSEHSIALQPRLYIKASPQTDTIPPGDVTGLSANPGDWNGEILLSFTAPDDPSDPDGADDPDKPRAFGYTIRYAAHEDFNAAIDVDRWRIPRPGAPGTTDRVLIENLEPGSTYFFWVQAYDSAGNAGMPAVTSLILPDVRSVPNLGAGDLPEPDPSGRQIAGVPDVLNYWACSELAKIDPDDGSRLEDSTAQVDESNYKKANAVWDSRTNTITLHMLRNEVMGFQLIIQRLLPQLTGVSLSCSDLSGPDDAMLSADHLMEFFKLHYVGDTQRFADPAIPLSPPFSQSFDIPSVNNPAGVCQSIWCDVYLPEDAAPGRYTGILTLSCNEAPEPVSIPLEIIAAVPVIPDTPTFFIDLNGYGNKWSSMDSLYQVFQLCHKHRMVPNTLPYGWSEHWTADRAPEISGTCEATAITDWSSFAGTYGPFFDGSAFSPDHDTYPYIGPGQNTAISNFYTTGFEGWPVSISNVSCGYDEISGGMGHAYWNSLVDAGGMNLQTFWLEAPDIMEAFPDSYAQGVRQVWQAFAEYARDHHWNTAFQFYLNNKRDYSGTSSLWTLEEQYTADDFRADAWFMGLCRQGWEAAGEDLPPFQWRIDTSTRWQQNWGQLNGICNLRVQGDGRNWDYKQDRYRHVTRQTEESRWWYGTGPGRTDPLTLHPAAFLMHWSHGLNGGLPYWNNYDSNWTTAAGSDDGEDAALSILMSGNSVPGHGTFDGRIATVRMKAMRFSQQLIEMLNLLASRPGWNRNITARSLSAAYGDQSGDGYDAFGGDEYTSMSILDYYRLRADIIACLESGTPDTDNDGDVDGADLLQFSRWYAQGLANGHLQADINRDLSVDPRDIAEFAAAFGRFKVLLIFFALHSTRRSIRIFQR